jgi:hypothetical protein
MVFGCLFLPLTITEILIVPCLCLVKETINGFLNCFTRGFFRGKVMKGEWSGGKGDSRRKHADDKKYRDGWDRIWKKDEKRKPQHNS